MNVGARLRSTARWKKATLVGLVVVVGIAAVLVRDIVRIDPTSGGYDPPFNDYSGDPIDWWAHEHTERGFRDRGGWLLDSSLDCTTGQIHLHVGPLAIPYRKLSERAIAVHMPHRACSERGFEPEWSFPESDLE